MKTPARSAALAATVSLLFVAACSRPAEKTAPDNNPAPRTEGATSTTDVPQDGSAPSIAAIPAAAINSAQRAAAKVEAASTRNMEEFNDTPQSANSDSAKIFNDAVGDAQKFLASRRHRDALAALEPLKKITLTPQQQKTVDELRASITAGLQQR